MQPYKLDPAVFKRYKRVYSEYYEYCKQYDFCVTLDSYSTRDYGMRLPDIHSDDKVRFQMEFPDGLAYFSPENQ